LFVDRMVPPQVAGTRRLSVLHAPVILNQGYYYSLGLRSLGHKCDYMVFDCGEEDRNLHLGSDINLRLTGKGYLSRMIILARFIMKSLSEYDVFHFHSGRTLFPLVGVSRWSPVPKWLGRHLSFLDFLDLSLMRRLGKKIVFQFWGCDIRSREKCSSYPYSTCFVCTAETRRNHCEGYPRNKIEKILDRYAHASLSNGDIVTYFPSFQWMNNAIDPDSWRPLACEEIPVRFRLPRNGKVRVYHSYTKTERGDVKGTGYLREAVETLQKEGEPVELMYCQDLDQQNLKYYQMQADIVVEQLLAGAHGQTAVECMSMGKPVLSYLREDVETLMPRNHPIVNASPETVKEKLRSLIRDPGLRTRIGENSRRYVEEVHDYRVVARELERLYFSL
jgi:glycosyltransferase involved in cell wall biosynthesis